MYYDADQNHGLPHDPFKALVVPRPIGWISTRNKAGEVNLAPYSYFNALSDRPKLVFFSSSMQVKDSATFAQDSGEFVANFVSESLAQQMNATSVNAPRGISEFAVAGLHEAPCMRVNAPRVAEAYAALECKVTQVLVPRTLDGSDAAALVVIGQVVGVHIDDSILSDGLVDIRKARPVSRLGYMDFGITADSFSMLRPKWQK
ncbi:MAG TPA: flavin reductase family protein [Polyangiales bacterium]|nr:flavin reductase family protein [Polyangiales bacterium]